MSLYKEYVIAGYDDDGNITGYVSGFTRDDFIVNPSISKARTLGWLDCEERLRKHVGHYHVFKTISLLDVAIELEKRFKNEINKNKKKKKD